MTLKGQIQLLSFCAFELCVGIFWPSMMSMRANYVPEELRATIINIFRIPLNAFVCIVLGNVSCFAWRCAPVMRLRNDTAKGPWQQCNSGVAVQGSASAVDGRLQALCDDVLC
jgi:hypothetical protein